MATKSALQTLINDFTTNGLNTALEFRTFMGDFLNTVYGTTVKDSQATETYTGAVNGSAFPYSINLRKQGGITYVVGKFTTTTGSGGAQKLFTFKAGEYLPAQETLADGTTPVVVPFLAYDKVNSVTIRCELYYDGSDMAIRTLSTIPALSSADWRFVLQYNNAA